MAYQAPKTEQEEIDDAKSFISTMRGLKLGGTAADYMANQMVETGKGMDFILSKRASSAKRFDHEASNQFLMEHLEGLNKSLNWRVVAGAVGYALMFDKRDGDFRDTHIEVEIETSGGRATVVFHSLRDKKYGNELPVFRGKGSKEDPILPEQVTRGRCQALLWPYTVAIATAMNMPTPLAQTGGFATKKIMDEFPRIAFGLVNGMGSTPAGAGDACIYIAATMKQQYQETFNAKMLGRAQSSGEGSKRKVVIYCEDSEKAEWEKRVGREIKSVTKMELANELNGRFQMLSMNDPESASRIRKVINTASSRLAQLVSEGADTRENIAATVTRGSSNSSAPDPPPKAAPTGKSYSYTGFNL